MVRMLGLSFELANDIGMHEGMLVDAASTATMVWRAMTTVLETGYGMRLRDPGAKQARHSVLAMHQHPKKHTQPLHSRQ